jgi:hypothetical protein
MTDLIDLIKQNLPSLRIRILLGGSEVEYEGAKLKGVQTLANSLRDSAPYNNKIYISEYEGNLLNIPRIECGVSECNILAADTSKSDKNRHSIVLEIKKDDISILLTGDAPGRVINNILQPYKDDPNKKINIFQATHHGADSEGSNSAESFYYLRPEYCVISAGSRRDYGHPRQQMILNALNSPNMQETQIPHFLQYYSDYSFIDSHPNLNEHLTIGRLENDFVIGFTKLGIFSTASQGDIHFEEGSFTFTKGPPLSSFENLETLPLMFDFIQYYTQLGYSSSLLSYKLPHVKFENLEQLIYFTVNLIGNHPNIISCDLSRAEFLDTNFKYEAVLDLVRTLKDVREADFPFSLALDERTKKHIISIWKNK